MELLLVVFIFVAVVLIGLKSLLPALDSVDKTGILLCSTIAFFVFNQGAMLKGAGKVIAIAMQRGLENSAEVCLEGDPETPNEAALLRSSFAWKALLAMYSNSAARNSSGREVGVFAGMT